MLISENDIGRCSPAGYTVIILELLNYIPWAGDYAPSLLDISFSSHSVKAFSGLRVFALTGGNRFLAPVVFVLSLGPLITNLVRYSSLCALFITAHCLAGYVSLGYHCVRSGLRLLARRRHIFHSQHRVCSSMTNTKSHSIDITMLRCLFLISKSIHVYTVYSFTVTVLSRVPLIIADMVVIIVTWVTTYKTATLSRNVLNHNQPTFSGLLLRDGTLYFT